MARIYGLNGALRGKQGNNVFSIQNGTQVVKAYQPVVSNPRTFPQQIQRAKFALAGELSSVIPSGALVGMPAENKRGRRAAFVSDIARSATTTTTPSAGGYIVKATIDYLSIRFARGSMPAFSAHTGFAASYQGNSGAYRMHVTLNGFSTDTIQADAPAGYGELVIVCMFNPSTSRIDACQYAIRTNDAMAFDFPVISRTECQVCLYIVPFAPLDGISRFGAPGALGNGTSGVELNLLSESFVSGMRFGVSYCSFSQHVNAPTTMAAPTAESELRKSK